MGSYTQQAGEEGQRSGGENWATEILFVIGISCKEENWARNEKLTTLLFQGYLLCSATLAMQDWQAQFEES